MFFLNVAIKYGGPKEPRASKQRIYYFNNELYNKIYISELLIIYF